MRDTHARGSYLGGRQARAARRVTRMHQRRRPHLAATAHVVVRPSTDVLALTTCAFRSLALLPRNVVVHMPRDATTDIDESPTDAAGQDETLDKLRLANQALRQQLKDFSKALDQSLQANAEAAGGADGAIASRDREAFMMERKRMMAALGGKEKQLRQVKKKLEIYKKANVEFKKQVGSTYNTEKLAALQAERDEKETLIQQLTEENRTLVQLQRNQAKKIQEQEMMKNEWPTKVSSLMADLRVSKERVRKAKEREAKAQELTKRQHEQMMKLADKNEKLRAQLLEYERNQGTNLAEKQKRKLVSQWKDEKEKLQHAISVLEKSKVQERTKGERLLRANVAELQKVKKEMEKHRSALEEKEKEIRMQLFQVKKLKRQLRELALGEVPLAKGWEGQATQSPAMAARQAARAAGEELDLEDDDGDDGAAAGAGAGAATSSRRRGDDGGGGGDGDDH